MRAARPRSAQWCGEGRGATTCTSTPARSIQASRASTLLSSCPTVADLPAFTPNEALPKAAASAARLLLEAGLVDDQRIDLRSGDVGVRVDGAEGHGSIVVRSPQDPSHAGDLATDPTSMHAEAVDVDNIDDLDRALVHALQIDGRAPFRRVAAVLGVADQTIARRYARLRRAGLLQMVGVTDPDLLNAPQWIVRLSLDPPTHLV